MESINNCA
ncbi:hypothetical protein C9885_29765, partial [Klebsiella pneumoniae]